MTHLKLWGWAITLVTNHKCPRRSHVVESRRLITPLFSLQTSVADKSTHSEIWSFARIENNCHIFVFWKIFGLTYLVWLLRSAFHCVAIFTPKCLISADCADATKKLKKKKKKRKWQPWRAQTENGWWSSPRLRVTDTFLFWQLIAGQ